MNTEEKNAQSEAEVSEQAHGELDDAQLEKVSAGYAVGLLSGKVKTGKDLHL